MRDKDPDFKLLRFQCFQWIQHHTDLIQFRPRTKEIIYLILECLLSKFGKSVDNPELVCIVCICFGAKLETDFNRQFCDFLDYILNERSINVSDIKRFECEILLSLPDCFGVTIPFADLANDLFRDSSADLKIKAALVDFVYSTYLKSLAKYGPSEDLLDVSVALLSPTTSNRKQVSQTPSQSNSKPIENTETFLGKRIQGVAAVSGEMSNMQKKLKKLKA